jgi:hypothetical protein
MQHKHAHHRMELEYRTLKPHTHGYLRQRPPFANPKRHGANLCQGHGDGRAFEVIALPGLVFGDHGDGDVEAREAGQAAEHEESEEQVVDGCAEAEGEGG